MEQTNTEDKRWCVYIHTNKINNKKYVGITSQNPPEKRWDEGRGYHRNKHFTSAIKKYGWDNFEHEIVADELTASEAEDMECSLIQEYNTMDQRYGYNLTSGGEVGKIYSEEARRNISLSLRGEKHPNYGKHHSEETKRKIAEGNKGKIVSEETRKKMSEINKGRTYSEEYKQRMSETLKGRIFSEEHRQHLREALEGREFSEEHKSKLSEAAKERWQNEEYRKAHCGENHRNVAGAANPRAKKVIRLSDRKIYDYIGQASEDNNVVRNTIFYRCKKHKGFMFYEEYLAQLNTKQND